MKLQDFQFYVDRIIVDRGDDYYSSGLVTPMDSKGAAYRFQVRGSDEYEVIITLNPEGEILSSYCDCPYDYGPVCKHETAAYFDLMEQLHESDDEPDVSIQWISGNARLGRSAGRVTERPAGEHTSRVGRRGRNLGKPAAHDVFG